MSAPWQSSFDTEDNDLGDDGFNSLVAEEAKTKDAVIFLVDANDTMFQARGTDGATAFGDALEVITGAVKDLIISSKDTKVSIAFFCTREKKNQQGNPGTYVFNDPREPDAPMVKSLMEFNNQDEFKEQIGSGPCEFQNVIWACSSVFHNLNKMNKRVWIFTNQNDPCRGDANVVRAARKLHFDAEANDIEFEVMPLNDDFDPRPFWKYIHHISDDEDATALKEARFESVQNLRRKMRKREFKKRALGSVKMQLSPNIGIGVKLYCMLKENKKDYPVNLDRRTNEPLTCVTSWVCQSSGAVLEKDQIQTYYPYGGTRVNIDKPEMNEIKDVGDPGLTLLGFKGASRLKQYHNIKQPYFVFPDEARVKGSNVAFNALLQQMIRMNKIAIARLIYRKHGVPRFVALLPQEEELDPEDNSQIKPAGFHMIFLPYADDIRKLTFEKAPRAPDELILKAKNLVDKLRIKFGPNSFENPVLQRHYAVLQALALEEELPEETEDTLVPPYAGFEKFRHIFEAFSDALQEIEVDEPAPKKRRAPASKGGSRAKKAKVDGGAINWAEYNTEAKLKKLKVDQLKDYLRENGLPLKGKKADLIDRILDAMA